MIPRTGFGMTTNYSQHRTHKAAMWIHEYLRTFVKKRVSTRLKRAGLFLSFCGFSIEAKMIFDNLDWYEDGKPQLLGH